MRFLIALLAFTTFGQMHPSPGPGRAAAGGGGPSYIFEENFEAPGFENAGWTTQYFTANYATSPAPLVGSYSGRHADPWGGESTFALSPTFTTITGRADIYFQVYVISTSLFSPDIIQGRNDSTSLFYCSLSSWDGQKRVLTVSLEGGTAAQTNILWEGPGLLHFWVEYTPGSPATVNLYQSTTATKPGTPTISANDVNITSGLNRIRFGSFNQSNNIIDKIRVDDEEIGSNPE